MRSGGGGGYSLPLLPTLPPPLVLWPNGEGGGPSSAITFLTPGHSIDSHNSLPELAPEPILQMKSEVNCPVSPR